MAAQGIPCTLLGPTRLAQDPKAPTLAQVPCLWDFWQTFPLSSTRELAENSPTACHFAPNLPRAPQHKLATTKKIDFAHEHTLAEDEFMLLGEGESL